MKRIWIVVLIGLGVAGIVIILSGHQGIQIIQDTTYQYEKSIEQEFTQMKKGKTGQPLYEVYHDLPVIDVHNHSVEYFHMMESRNMNHVKSVKELWQQYGIDHTVLFGDVSEPSAIQTDRLSWRYYQEYPDLIYPSFAGIPLEKGKNGVEKVQEQLEKGYLNVGEIYAASRFSPSANVRWKGEHPYSGVLPEIYEVVAEYTTPIMLHIDPPRGKNMSYFRRALTNHPETLFIFAHGNVYTSPKKFENLLADYDNLYIDFFAGFTQYNESSQYKLRDFVPVIEKYPNQFMLGSDSGVEIGIEKSYQAMYELIDQLTPATAVKVAYQNYERLIEEQPFTKYQKNRIQELAEELMIENKTYRLNKHKANELIFELSN
ncbi:amidohydrolase family protein [Salinibacillus xinjiangensis]|uniref:Amidohydrolase family protein n=1 Tax=Salinibacillus xinjiangensis TaxID=1229268 RepID=A0A6G1X4H5_9BACI|nr:amidohydrolase family protein [Salinibacillus xinjiangensis]MRG85780.1 amidohydrolase family protein [Salinibacillus xinjiangensis]